MEINIASKALFVIFDCLTMLFLLLGIVENRQDIEKLAKRIKKLENK